MPFWNRGTGGGTAQQGRGESPTHLLNNYFADHSLPFSNDPYPFIHDDRLSHNHIPRYELYHRPHYTMTVPVPVSIPTVPFVCPPTPTLAREEVANDQSKRVYPHNLRWVLFGTSLVGIIWAVAMGVQQFQNRTSDASQSFHI
jgi:hypothetical protein